MFNEMKPEMTQEEREKFELEFALAVKDYFKWSPQSAETEQGRIRGRVQAKLEHLSEQYTGNSMVFLQAKYDDFLDGDDNDRRRLIKQGLERIKLEEERQHKEDVRRRRAKLRSTPTDPNNPLLRLAHDLELVGMAAQEEQKANPRFTLDTLVKYRQDLDEKYQLDPRALDVAKQLKKFNQPYVALKGKQKATKLKVGNRTYKLHPPNSTVGGQAHSQPVVEDKQGRVVIKPDSGHDASMIQIYAKDMLSQLNNKSTDPKSEPLDFSKRCKMLRQVNQAKDSVLMLNVFGHFDDAARALHAQDNQLTPPAPSLTTMSRVEAKRLYQQNQLSADEVTELFKRGKLDQRAPVQQQVIPPPPPAPAPEDHSKLAQAFTSSHAQSKNQQINQEERLEELRKLSVQKAKKEIKQEQNITNRDRSNNMLG